MDARRYRGEIAKISSRKYLDDTNSNRLVNCLMGWLFGINWRNKATNFLTILANNHRHAGKIYFWPENFKHCQWRKQQKLIKMSGYTNRNSLKFYIHICSHMMDAGYQYGFMMGLLNSENPTKQRSYVIHKLYNGSE